MELAEARGYDTDFYVTPLNTLRIYCEYEAAVLAINRTPKTVIASKTLGGGARLAPGDGLTVAYASLKPGDIVAVGMENEECAAGNARTAEELLSVLAPRRVREVVSAVAAPRG